MSSKADRRNRDAAVCESIRRSDYDWLRFWIWRVWLNLWIKLCESIQPLWRRVSIVISAHGSQASDLVATASEEATADMVEDTDPTAPMARHMAGWAHLA